MNVIDSLVGYKISAGSPACVSSDINAATKALANTIETHISHAMLMWVDTLTRDARLSKVLHDGTLSCQPHASSSGILSLGIFSHGFENFFTKKTRIASSQSRYQWQQLQIQTSCPSRRAHHLASRSYLRVTAVAAPSLRECTSMSAIQIAPLRICLVNLPFGRRISQKRESSGESNDYINAMLSCVD